MTIRTNPLPKRGRSAGSFLSSIWVKDQESVNISGKEYGPVKIIFATQLYPDQGQGATLSKVGGVRRLLSYLYIRDEQEAFKEYGKTGMRGAE